MIVYKSDYLEKYVKLAIHIGVNIQKGQRLVISSPVECSYFVRLAVSEAYHAGACDVIVRWHDEQCTRAKYLYAPDEVFDTYYPWNKMMLNDLAKEGAAFLSISASNPEALKGVDFSRVIRANKAADKAIKEYRDRMMASFFQWSVLSVPSEAWAKKVFPNEINIENAIEKLWDAIYGASRIDENDPVVNWKNHVATIGKNKDILNNYNFKLLRYNNSIGTDLEIELPEGHIWAGGDELAKNGVTFLANIPTEEIFTAPKRDGVNGKVVGSKPFIYGGNVVENFSFTFKKGKAVDFTADNDKDKEIIDKLLTSIKNMDYLGEVALVPFTSPISNTNILFYNTLYDENASCHFALGQAYPDCIKGGAEMNTKERTKAGLNVSDDHHDFMIGSSDMQIIGVTHDNREITVFKDGNFAF